MQITRSGHGAYHGHTKIELQPFAQWDEKAGAVELVAHGVHDFNTPAHHDYTLALSLGEVARILRVLSVAAEDRASRIVIGGELHDSLGDLLLLAHAAHQCAGGAVIEPDLNPLTRGLPREARPSERERE